MQLEELLNDSRGELKQRRLKEGKLGVHLERRVGLCVVDPRNAVLGEGEGFQGLLFARHEVIEQTVDLVLELLLLERRVLLDFAFLRLLLLLLRVSDQQHLVDHLQVDIDLLNQLLQLLI